MNIKQIKTKLSKAEAKLEELENRNFKRKQLSSTLSEWEVKKEADEMKKRIGQYFFAYTRTRNIIGKKIEWAALGKTINKDPRTAKKLYLAWENNQKIVHGNRLREPINKTKDYIKEKYLQGILDLIQECNNFLNPDGSKTLLVLTHIIPKIEKSIPVNQRVNISTIRKWIRLNPKYLFKYTSKARRNIMNKIITIRKQIEDTKQKLSNLKIYEGMRRISFSRGENVQEIVSVSKDGVKVAKPQVGTVVQWDGSYDDGYNGQKFLRIQCVDVHGYSYGISYDRHEKNKGYKEVLVKMLSITNPYVIFADRRKGVDPADIGALVAGICFNLGIIIIASSVSNDKALIEKINGLMHSFSAIHFTENNIKTLKEVKACENILNEEYNEFYNCEKPKYNGKRISNEILEFLAEDLEVVVGDNPQFLRYKKAAYQLVKNGKIVKHPENSSIIFGKYNGAVKVLFKNELYETIKLDNADLKTSYLAKSFMRKKLINNSIIVVNNESFDYLMKEAVTSIERSVEKKSKLKYQSHIIKLNKEIMTLKGIV